MSETGRYEDGHFWYTERQAPDVSLSIRCTHLYGERTPFQRIDFYESDTFGRFFTLDGLMMLTEKDERHYHEMLVHVPMAVHPDVRRVLIVGGGDGGTARELSRYPGIEVIDMVEIDRRVVELCRVHLPSTAGRLDEDPRIRLHYMDGVRFLREADDDRYDLVLVDSTDPVGPGEGLFSRRFYSDCHRVLGRDGILVNQHESPFYPSYSRSMQRSHQRLRDTFPIARVYLFHMPVYPSGMWLFGFASKGPDPVRDLRPDALSAQPDFETRYYTPSVHAAAFALPRFVERQLQEAAG